METAAQYVFAMFSTMLGYWIRLWRRAQLLGQPTLQSRFVPFRARAWSSDLLWSSFFWKSIQFSKWNSGHEKYPPIHWRGILLMKDPFSLASYPLLIFELAPATIIEIGAFNGGSATWLADMMEIQGIDGRVYSHEINVERITAKHPRVQFKRADSRDLSSFDAELLASLPHPWIVIEDAHTNVYNLLRFFNGMMKSGDYLVVEDTVHRPKYDELRKFMLEQGGNFLVDTRYTDLFGYNVTWHPNGYLKKIH